MSQSSVKQPLSQRNTNYQTPRETQGFLKDLKGKMKHLVHSGKNKKQNTPQVADDVQVRPPARSSPVTQVSAPARSSPVTQVSAPSPPNAVPPSDVAPPEVAPLVVPPPDVAPDVPKPPSPPRRPDAAQKPNSISFKLPDSGGEAEVRATTPVEQSSSEGSREALATFKYPYCPEKNGTAVTPKRTQPDYEIPESRHRDYACTRKREEWESIPLQARRDTSRSYRDCTPDKESREESLEARYRRFLQRKNQPRDSDHQDMDFLEDDHSGGFRRSRSHQFEHFNDMGLAPPPAPPLKFQRQGPNVQGADPDFEHEGWGGARAVSFMAPPGPRFEGELDIPAMPTYANPFGPAPGMVHSYQNGYPPSSTYTFAPPAVMPPNAMYGPMMGPSDFQPLYMPQAPSYWAPEAHYMMANPFEQPPPPQFDMTSWGADGTYMAPYNSTRDDHPAMPPGSGPRSHHYDGSVQRRRSMPASG